ncbi:MAG: ATP-binding protein [Vicinamibacterales bacterium]
MPTDADESSPAAASSRIRPRREALAVSAIVLAVSALGLGVTYYFARQAQVDAVRAELGQLASVAAVQVDGDLHRRVVRPELEGSPEFLQALAPLVHFHLATRDVIYVYTLVLRNGEAVFGLDSAYKYRIAGDDQPHDPPGTLMAVQDPDSLAALQRDEVVVNREVSRGRVRSYLSAFAPFHDARGVQVGVVGVDMWVRDLDARLARLARIASAALVGLVLIAVAVGLVVFRLRTAAALAESRDRQAVRDLAAARDAAEQSSRAKSAFLAMMSHELRTPLNAIIGYGEMLQEDLRTRGDHGMADDVGHMLGAGRHLTSIIGDILDYSKLEAGRLELRSAGVDVAALAGELVELMLPVASAKGVALSLECTQGLSPVAADPVRLRQVLLNLIGNALKFTERGAVSVRVRRSGGGVVCVVHDTGIGIPAEKQAQLFQPFSQVDASPSRRAAGTGLGLAISRRLVELMRGTLRVRSRAGRGSTFRVCLPACAA